MPLIITLTDLTTLLQTNNVTLYYYIRRLTDALAHILAMAETVLVTVTSAALARSSGLTCALFSGWIILPKLRNEPVYQNETN